jgi:hypothetical protein
LGGNPFLHHTAVVEALARCLSVNTTLQCVDVSDSNLTEHGIRLLANQLHAFSNTLQVLNLAGNDLTERAAASLVEGLRHNRTLESLGLDDISDCDCVPMMQHFLDLNRAGRRAMQNDIPLALWPQLLARAAGRMDQMACGRNENVLYSLLRGPALSF